MLSQRGHCNSKLSLVEWCWWDTCTSYCHHWKAQRKQVFDPEGQDFSRKRPFINSGGWCLGKPVILEFGHRPVVTTQETKQNKTKLDCGWRKPKQAILKDTEIDLVSPVPVLVNLDSIPQGPSCSWTLPPTPKTHPLLKWAAAPDLSCWSPCRSLKFCTSTCWLFCSFQIYQMLVSSVFLLYNGSRPC